MRSRAGWHLIWTIPAAIAVDAVLALIASLANWGNSAGTAINEEINGYLLSHQWVWLTLIGLVTSAAVAIPAWHQSLTLRLIISAAVAIVVVATAAMFAVQ